MPDGIGGTFRPKLDSPKPNRRPGFTRGDYSGSLSPFRSGFGGVSVEYRRHLEEIARQSPSSLVTWLYRNLHDVFIMHSMSAGHQKIAISELWISTYARNPKERREQNRQCMTIVHEPTKAEPLRLDLAILIASRYSSRMTVYGRKILLLGVCAWLSHKFIQS